MSKGFEQRFFSRRFINGQQGKRNVKHHQPFRNGSQDHSKVHFISTKIFIIKKTEKSKWSSICREAEILRPCWEGCAMSVGWNLGRFSVSHFRLRTLRRNELTCLHRNVPTDVHSSMSHSSHHINTPEVEEWTIDCALYLHRGRLAGSLKTKCWYMLQSGQTNLKASQ